MQRCKKQNEKRTRAERENYFGNPLKWNRSVARIGRARASWRYIPRKRQPATNPGTHGKRTNKLIQKFTKRDRPFAQHITCVQANWDRSSECRQQTTHRKRANKLLVAPSALAERGVRSTLPKKSENWKMRTWTKPYDNVNQHLNNSKNSNIHTIHS